MMHEQWSAGRPGRTVTTASLAVLTVLAGLAGCASHQPAPGIIPVSSAGGTVPLTPGASLRVAAGTAPGTTVRGEQVPDTPAYPGGIARAVGKAINVIPSGPMAASTIRIRFDPAEELPPATPGAAAPTTGNAFIAVLNKPTGTWVPLATSYDAATHDLEAVAPHFSTFRTFVTLPGRYLISNELAGLSIVIKAGESGLRAAEAEGDAVWDAVRPEDGAGLRRTLPASERIDKTCAGNDPGLPWDRRYQIAVSDETMKLRSCVVDPSADQARPALLMENDYGFPLDVFPQKGAVLPALAVGTHPDQDAIAALSSLAGHGYIPGPGVTQIGFPAGQPPSFTVQARADWLGLVTDIILTAAAIIPDFEASETRFTAELENVIAEGAHDGQDARSATQTLRIVSSELKVKKGKAFETADTLASSYSCFAELSSIALTDSIGDLAGKVAACLKELMPSPGDVVTSGAAGVSEYAKYLSSLISYIQLPSVLNDFREHGRQVFSIDATTVPVGGTAQEHFRPFGRSLGTFTWAASGDRVSVSPPLGPDRYSALWGVSDSAQRCSVAVDLDSTLDDPAATGNFGFAIAPLSAVQADQPAGASVQYEHEAPPDFPAAGSFIRPALMPGGAWRVDVAPLPAPDIYQTHHVRVTDSAGTMNVAIDGRQVATYTHQAECGGVSIRAWGAPFTFSNVVVSGS